MWWPLGSWNSFMLTTEKKKMAAGMLKRYLEMKNLEGWKEYKEMKEKKVKKVGEERYK